VGGKTQLPAYRRVVGDLRLAHAQFEELETFARFATRLDEDTRATIERGRRVREVLKQPDLSPLRVAEQIAVLHAVNAGVLDPLALDDVAEGEQAIRAHVREHMNELAGRIDAGEMPSDEEWDLLAERARAVVRDLLDRTRVG
jgi:F-type H+-transporting ATPase subunit alpha